MGSVMHRPPRRLSWATSAGVAFAPAALLLGLALGASGVVRTVTAADAGWVSLEGYDAVRELPAALCPVTRAVESEATALHPGDVDGTARIAFAATAFGPTADCGGRVWHTLEAAEWERRFPGLEIESAPACVAASAPPPTGEWPAAG